MDLVAVIETITLHGHHKFMIVVDMPKDEKPTVNAI